MVWLTVLVQRSVLSLTPVIKLSSYFNLSLCVQRSLEVVGDIEELIEWLRGADATLRSCAPPAASASALRAQLQAQRPLAEEVSAQRVRAKDLLAQAKKVAIKKNNN